MKSTIRKVRAKSSQARARSAKADRPKGVRLVSRKGRRLKIIAEAFVLRKINGEPVLQAVSAWGWGTPGSCSAHYDEDGHISCWGVCKQGKFCNMLITRGRKKMTIRCSCSKLTGGDDPPEVIDPWSDWDA